MNCLSEKKKLSICVKPETEEDKTKDVIIFAMESRTNSWNGDCSSSLVPLTESVTTFNFSCAFCVCKNVCTSLNKWQNFNERGSYHSVCYG
jgi:hypothetical protein